MSEQKASPSEACIVDDALMMRLRSRDEAALAELFDRYARLVFGIALRVIRDQGEAEEIVQDVFLRLLQHAGKFDPAKGTLRAWISHLALQQALDRRSFLTRRRFYDGTDLEFLEDSLKGDQDLEAEVAGQLIGTELRKALDELPPKQSITLEWFFYEGCSLREISERLDETLVNARHHFYRGLETLRRSSIVVRLKRE